MSSISLSDSDRLVLSAPQSCFLFSRMHQLHLHTLSNGVRLLTVSSPATSAVTTLVLMRVGSRFESDAQRGLAHFTEHMVFKGGRDFPSYRAITHALDGVGGEFNAYTSQEYTGFYTRTAVEHLRLGASVLSDMVLRANFPEEELEKEKGVIVEEINMYEDMPMHKVGQVLSDLCLGDTPLGRPIIGTKESVMGFTREDFLKYRDEFYHGGACVLVMAGAIAPEQSIPLAEEFFSSLPAGEAITPLPGAWEEGRVSLLTKPAEQSHLQIAVPSYPIGHPKRAAYRVMNTILGGNMSSRLFTEVREEQGLCYYVRSSPDSYTDLGMLVCTAGVDNNRLEQAVTAIVEECRGMITRPVAEEELTRAKQFLLGHTKLGMEDGERVAELYGMQLLLENKLEPIDEFLEKIAAVTEEDVHEVAKELFVPGAMRLAVVGPYDKADVLEKMLI